LKFPVVSAHMMVIWSLIAYYITVHLDNEMKNLIEEYKALDISGRFLMT